MKLRVDSIGVVAVHLFLERTSKLIFVQDDHVIESFDATTAEPSLGDLVLPGAAVCRLPRLDPTSHIVQKPAYDRPDE